MDTANSARKVCMELVSVMGLIFSLKYTEKTCLLTICMVLDRGSISAWDYVSLNVNTVSCNGKFCANTISRNTPH